MVLDHCLGSWHVLHINEEDLHQGPDFREGEVGEVEKIAGGRFLNQLSPLRNEHGLGLADRAHGWIDEARVMEAVAVLVQMLPIDTDGYR